MDWPSLRAELCRGLGRPKGLVMTDERAVIAIDLAILVDKIQPPAVGLLADGRMARCAMGADGLVSRQGGDGDATVNNILGCHG